MEILRWACCAAALVLLALGPAHAADISKLGVMSVLGREVSVIIHAPTTGTRVNRNAKDTIAMAPNDFENFVLRTTVDSARREGLGEVLMLARPANGNMPWRRDGQAVLVTRPLLEAAQSAKLSHLILIQPAQGEASLKMDRTVVGAGQLEGLGFYVDTMLTVGQVDSNQTSFGYLAPYAYFDMYLVDVATLDLQAEHRARVSVALADPVGAGNDPWSALSAERKVEVIRGLLQQEVEKAIRDWASQQRAASGASR